MPLIKKIKNRVGWNLINAIGWKTDKKIVVFESDDWGSIRMPSKLAYSEMVDHNIISPDYPYAKFDSLESESDIKGLIDVLIQYQDNRGIPPVFTTNVIVANPDFALIESCNFERYYYEDFRETYKKYPEHFRSFDFFVNGINAGVFYPQFHGRDHINVHKWLKGLQDKDFAYLKAFDQKTFVVQTHNAFGSTKSLPAALDFNDESSLEFSLNALQEGCQMFERIFGFKSLSFVAPNYIWHRRHEEILAHLGVKFIQGTKFQNIPAKHKNKYKRTFRFTGSKNEYNQTNIVRNCFFEPSSTNYALVLDSCLREISNAFFWGKPAVISSHRLNYIGYLNKENQIKNLRLLSKLIEQILKKWPDVTFMTTPELGKYIVNAE